MIAIFAVVAMMPIYLFGVPSGNDQSQHYQFAWTVYNSVANGDVFPSFASDTNHGFGDYGLRFYPPLTYYVLTGIRAVTGDWYAATLIALTLVFFTGAMGVFLWTLEMFDRKTALIAAAFYTSLPYHLNEIYNNFLLAEFFATAVLPFCFLYLHRVLRDPRTKNVLLLAIASSLLVLTHLPLTLIGGLALSAYAVASLKKDELPRQLASLLGAAVLTGAMTSFYWTRWITELAWITHNSDRYFSSTWDYRTNFLFVPSHWTDIGSDFLNLWFADLMLLVPLLVVAPAAILFATKPETGRSFIPLTGVFAIATLLTTPLTKPVWDNLPLLQKVQFPWRWLAVVSIAAAPLGAAGIAWAGDQLKQGRKPAVAIVTSVALAAVAFMAVTVIKGPVFVSREKLSADISTFNDSTGCDCWWPVWARSGAFGQHEKVVAGDRDVSITQWTSTERSFKAGPGDAATATVKTWYYPRWHAIVNGSAVETKPDVNGALSIDLPAGAADVSLRFVEPAYVIIATAASILVWVAVLSSLSAMLVQSRRRRNGG